MSTRYFSFVRAPLSTILSAVVLGLGLTSTTSAASLLDYMIGTQFIHCAEAIASLKPSAKRGDAAAQYALGQAYVAELEECSGRKRDWSEAFYWYQKAAEQGHAEAQYELASIYNFGWIGPEDKPQALAWYQKAAAQNHRSAMRFVAKFYRDGELVDKDRVLHYMLSVLGYQDKEWDAQVYVPDLLANIARKMSPEQLAEAEQLMKEWKVGSPLPTNSKTGRKHPLDWFLKEAEAGNLEAQYQAGRMCKEGDLFSGMREDDVKAVYWLRKAAARGHADAQYHLAVMHEQVRAVPPDAVIAFLLWHLAASSGHDLARDKRDWLEKILNEAQRAEAKALLSTWRVGAPLPVQTKTGVRQAVATTNHHPN